ncbi:MULTISPECIES: choline/ethanolamine kinase family protein [unclassified Rhizobium]|uniref:choline/ethanolamine kinase family protein n=1 Tax=unclassified Rhizobium TaxID=2613769 RepID=UPI001ADBC1E6|nr:MULTISPECIES: choline/ethanolamine kinase family protein [unclassified Rhizobium]MBO9099632.1 phosphotransferase family protein [Rhizobium sp. L58/93]QXZ86898.1 phosphotransferase family protein [Rhizobium sp. K1/93]QXZ93068.1 phosphotransferase family protein [Rhizobium sp. K15/93]
MSEAGQISEVTLTIESVLGRIPAWQGRIDRFASVGGGISNSNWRVWIAGEKTSFFVKIPGRGTEMFINRAVALEASLNAEAAGIGPRVHRLEAPEGVEIVEFVEGYRTASNRDFLRESVRSVVIDAYRKLHASKPLSQTKTVFDMIEEHLAQIAAVSASMSTATTGLIAAYRQARQALEASGLDLVPCFNDPMPGNFLLSPDDHLVLIDYEYSSNNDRCYDLGAWSTEMFFDRSLDAAMVEDYFGSFDERLMSRVTIYRALADIKWTLWSVLQNKISALDFDFSKYGLWKLLRARSVIDDQNWPTLLKGL